jgi:hypothetical protein
MAGAVIALHPKHGDFGKNHHRAVHVPPSLLARAEVIEMLSLGRVLSTDDLKGTVFLINGHTDTKGNAEYKPGPLLKLTGRAADGR